MTTRTVQPPGHLSRDARQLWRRLHAEYRFDARGSLELLTAAVEAWDRARTCRMELKGQPLTTVGAHGGVRLHPLVTEERAQREQFARLCRLLRIHYEGEPNA